MRILQLHNQYFSGLGGEDTVVRLEASLLREHGHEVRQHIVSTAQLKDTGWTGLARAGFDSIWSQASYESVAAEVASFRPHVVHVHNTFPLLSPSVYYATRRNDTPVVQTLHNYRLSCANGMLLRNNRPCEDCVGKSKIRGLLHRCYSGGSLGLSASVVAMQTAHRFRKTFVQQVDAYIALTDFQRDVMVREGLPAERIFIKPNFMAQSGTAIAPAERKKQIVFVGSIREEKGIDLLLASWARLRPPQHQLLVLGYGPAQEPLMQQYKDLPSVVWLGSQPAQTVLQTLAESRYIALCSRWYEGFPMVLLESFAVGTPAILPNHGAFPSILKGRNAGMFFEPCSEESLRHILNRALSVSQDEWIQHSHVAQEISRDYGPGENYLRLIQIYEAAVDHYRRSQSLKSQRG